MTARPRRRYVLHPGHVFARDGDRHFIGARDLVRLYGLSAAVCWIAPPFPDRPRMTYPPDAVHLYPRPSGDYADALAAAEAARPALNPENAPCRRPPTPPPPAA